MRYLIILIGLSLLTSCKFQQQKESMVLLQISKKPCLGKCQVYDFILSPERILQYHGIKNTQILGDHNFKISRKEFNRIIHLAEKIETELINYPSKPNGRDLPLTKFVYKDESLLFAGQNKPSELQELEILLNSLLLEYQTK